MSLSRKQRGGGHDSIIIEEIIKLLESFITASQLKGDTISAEQIEWLTRSIASIGEIVKDLQPSYYRFKARFSQEQINNLKRFCEVKTSLKERYEGIILIIWDVYKKIRDDKQKKQKASFANITQQLKTKFEIFAANLETAAAHAAVAHAAVAHAAVAHADVSDINGSTRSTGGRKWSLKYKRSIKCRRPKGFSQKQYCKRQGKKTRRV